MGKEKLKSESIVGKYIFKYFMYCIFMPLSPAHRYMYPTHTHITTLSFVFSFKKKSVQLLLSIYTNCACIHGSKLDIIIFRTLKIPNSPSSYQLPTFPQLLLWLSTYFIFPCLNFAQLDFVKVIHMMLKHYNSYLQISYSFQQTLFPFSYPWPQVLLFITTGHA